MVFKEHFALTANMADEILFGKERSLVLPFNTAEAVASDAVPKVEDALTICDRYEPKASSETSFSREHESIDRAAT